MYRLINNIFVRTANLSLNTSEHDRYLAEKLFVSTRSLFNQVMINNYSNEKIDKSLSKYENRARYRATPFGLFSSVKFTYLAEENKSQNQILIDAAFSVHTRINPCLIDTLIKNAKLENITKIYVQWNSTTIKSTPSTLYNLWPTIGSEISIDTNYLILEIKEITKKKIQVEELLDKLKEKTGSKIPQVIYLQVIYKLITNAFLITDLDNQKFYNSFIEFYEYMDKKEYLFPKTIFQNIKNDIYGVKSINNEFKIKKIMELEEEISFSSENKDCFSYSSETNIQDISICKLDIEKKLIPFWELLQVYAERVPNSKRYTKDVSYFLEKYGDTKVNFLDFYEEYLLIRNYNLSEDIEEYDIKKFLRLKIIQHLQLNPSEEFDLFPLIKEFEKYPQCKEAPLTFQSVFTIFKDNSNNLKLLLAPFEGTSGIGRIEGRFSFMDESSFEEIKKAEQSVFELAQIQIISIKYLPQNLKYYDIMNNDISKDENFQYSLIGGENTIQLQDIFIGCQDNKITFYHIKNGKQQIVNFVQYNVSNINKLGPQILQDLIYWSNEYYTDIFHLIKDIRDIRREFVFFPKITCKGTILFQRSFMPNILSNNRQNKSQFKKNIEELKTKYKINDNVFARDLDRGFLLNLSIDTDIDLAYELYKKAVANSVVFEEFEAYQEKTITRDLNGNSYLSEIVFNAIKKNVPLCKNNNTPIYYKRKTYFKDNPTRWLQINFYISNKYHHNFIKNHLIDILTKLKEDNLYTNFFYIRYCDERDHIRIRFKSLHCTDWALIYEKLDKILNAESGSVVYSIACYNPEIERYGGVHCIESAEDFFCKDSKLAIELLSRFSEENKHELVLYAILFAQIILNTFSSCLEEKLDFIQHNYSNREFQKDFRMYGEDYMRYYELANTISYNIETRIDINNIIVKEWKDCLEKYSTRINEYSTCFSRKDISLSLIHMMCIRIFGIKSEEEKKVMNILNRLTRKVIAIEKI